MDILTAALFVIALGLLMVAAALAVQVGRLTRRLRAFEDEWDHADDELRAALAEQPRLLLTVDVHNPLELARERSRWGARLIAFAPHLVTRRVYDEIARQIGDQLSAQGVDADIEIHKGKP